MSRRRFSFVVRGNRRVTAAVAAVITVTALLPAMAASSVAAVNPTAIVFDHQPSDGAPGVALATQPTVVLKDSNGAKVSSSDTVVLTLTGGDGKALTRAANLTCDAKEKAADDGTVTFAGCAVDRGGKFTLTATDKANTALKATSAPFVISGAAALRFATQPGGGAAGAVWATQPQVEVVDAHGDVVPSSTAHITLGISAGTGTAGATLGCTSNNVAVTTGTASFAGCSIDRSGTGYQLVAIDKDDLLISAPSDSFAVTAGTPKQLSFTTQPAGGTGGTAFTTQPVVAVQDAQGNVAVGNTDTITLALKAGTGTAGAQLSCSKKAVDGIASFANCSIDKAGSGYVLTATDSAANLHSDSSPFTVAAGGATGIRFTRQPGGGPGGAAFDAQPRVAITDAGGNPVPGSVTLSIKANTGTSGAVLSCDANPAAAPSGVATFAGCRIDRTGAGYQLHAVSGGFTADSAAFDVSAGVPATVTFASDPGNGKGGSALDTQPRVRVTDSGGNPAGAEVTLAITNGTGTPDANLSCDSNPVSTVNGIATFSGCDVDKIGAGYRLTATAGGAHGQSAAFDVTLGAAAQLAFTAQPGGGTGGAAWADQPVVTVQDAGGNQVRGSTASVALTITDGTGNGTLSCTADELPAVRGAARFDGCSIDRTASAYRLTATSAGLTTTSHTFAVTAGAPHALVFTQQPGGAVAGNAFANQPVVTLVDKGGNPSTGTAAVTLSITPGSGGTLSCSQATANPVAGWSGCSIDQAGGGYTLTASAGNRSVESAPFAVLLPTPAVGQAPTDVPAAQTYGRRLIGINPTDVKDDVNSSTGELTFSEKDLTVAGIGLPLVVERTYNSADTAGGSFGRGWTSLLDITVALNSTKTTATVRSEDGQQLVFRSNGTGGWTAPAGARSALSCNANACTVTRFDGTRYTVSAGRITSYLDPNGMGLRFVWSTGKVVITPQSTATTPRTVTATLDTAGRVTTIASPTRTVSYGYSTAGLLTSVTDVLGKTWTNTYTNGLLTKQTDPTGATRRTAGYDASGRVLATTQQGSSRHVDSTFAWTSTTSERKVLTNVEGSLQRATWTDTRVGNVLVAQRSPVGAVVRYSYDTHLNLVAQQDPTGWVEQLSYDAADNLVKVVDPITSTSSSVVKMTYDSAHRLLTQTDADGNTTTYVYNGSALGFVRPPGVTPGTWYTYNGAFELVKVQTATALQVLTYDAYGNTTGMRLQTLKGVSLNGNGTAVTYDEAGNRLTSLDPRGNLATVDNSFKTTSVYDKVGNLLSQATPGAATTTYTYDDAGAVKTATNGNGTTSYAWDENTRTLTSTLGGKPTTQVFDPSGHLLAQHTGPVAVTHTYDAAGRETSATDATGTTARYTYAVIGNVVRISDTTGNVLTRQYDSLGRTVREVSNGVERRASYDPAGNITVSRDSTGVTTRYTYDTHGKVSSVATDNGTTKYAYDPATDELLSVTDPNGHVTSYTYDAIARRTSTTLNSAVTKYSYDLAGNLNDVTDADGRRTVTTFDGRNLAVKKVSSQTGQTTLTVQNTYDARGRRTQMIDALGTHTYAYDAAGNLTSANTAGGTFGYDYSTPGQVLETYPDGAKVTTEVDDAQNVMSLETGTPGTDGYVHASYVRNANKQTTALAYSNGLLETVQYDAAGRVLDQQLRNAAGGVSDQTYTYDAFGNRVTDRTTIGGTTTANAYGYDSTGRLTSFRSNSGAGTLSGSAVPASPTASTAVSDDTDDTIAGGPAVASAYDVVSSVTAAGGALTSYAYDSVGNRTSGGTTYDAADRSNAYSHDKAGNVTKMPGKTLGYDAAGRLTSVATSSGTVTYSYDGDDNRITKTVGGNVVKYSWDPSGALPQLALERKGNNDLVRRYLNGDGPVAVQTPSATYYYSRDPQGSITALTDANGDVVASYAYDGYGNVKTTGAHAPANPVLFQGQYLDTDTGLYYLRARNYDPTTGRFTQRDPLEHGVGEAAESYYVFAGDRPTRFVDPSGRDASLTSGVEGKTDGEIAGNTLQGTKYANSAVTLNVKAIGYFGGYSAAVKQAALSAKIGAELAPEAAAAAKAGGTLAKVGVGLGVFGIALQVGLAVNDCLNDTVAKCVASTVSAAVGLTFLVACAGVTGGVAAAACAIGGAALSIALDQIISNYGPQIYEFYMKSLEITAGLIVRGAEIIYAATSTFFLQLGGAIISGWNDATTAIASGFNEAMSTLVDAGYAAAQLAQVLADGFMQGVNEVVGALSAFGYSVVEIAESIKDVFDYAADYVGNLLSKGFNYTALEIARGLLTVYDAAAEEVGKILKDVGYAVDVVAGALKGAYDLVATEAAKVLDQIGYGFRQVAGALQSVFEQADNLAASILADLGATAAQVAGALRDFYADATAVAASALKYAGYVVDEIAGALQNAYDAAAQAVAGVLKDLEYGAVAIAGVLKDVFDAAAVEAAQILRTLEFVLLDVSGALKDAYAAAAETAASVLRTIGYTVEQIGTALKTTFTQLASEAAGVLRDIGFGIVAVGEALQTAFQQTADQAAAVFTQLGYAIADVATALQQAFQTTAEDAVRVLDAFFDPTAIAGVLSSVYQQSVEAIAGIFHDLAYGATQIAQILSGAFQVAGDAVAQIFKDLGVAASEIASVLTGVFGEAVDAVANLLSSIGFGSDTINAIGGAFSDFGKAVENCFTSGFTDC